MHGNIALHTMLHIKSHVDVVSIVCLAHFWSSSTVSARNEFQSLCLQAFLCLQGNTALMLSIMANQVGCAEALLAKGAAVPDAKVTLLAYVTLGRCGCYASAVVAYTRSLVCNL